MEAQRPATQWALLVVINLPDDVAYVFLPRIIRFDHVTNEKWQIQFISFKSYFLLLEQQRPFEAQKEHVIPKGLVTDLLLL